MLRTLILLCSIALFSPAWLPAQDDLPLGKPESNDPEATAVLDALRQKYEAYQSLMLEFELVIDFPEQPSEVQQGKLMRSGDAYRVDMALQSVISDGQTLWLLLHSNQEVQINSVELAEEGGMFSPQSLFSFYQGGDYLYALVNEVAKEGTVVQQIEFKPMDKTSEFFKLRLEVDKKKNKPLRLMAFGRDNSKYTLEITAIQPNASISKDKLTFNKAEYPDYYVTDLRE